MRTSFLDPSRTIIGRCLTVLASLVLMANSIAPAIAVTLQNPRNHPVKPGPKPVQMKGVPRMDTSMKGLPIRVRKNEQISWLNERTQLNRRVTLADLAIAKGDAKVSGKSAKRADALIHLGEFAMVGREEPIEALGYFDKAIVAAPAGSRERGVAALDHGLAEVIRGAYAEAVGEFGHILRAKPRGANLKLVMNQFAHAKACLGYHQQHANL